MVTRDRTSGHLSLRYSLVPSVFYQIKEDGFVKSFLFRRGGIFAEKKSLSALADRRREKGVSSLQEPLCASISARKPAFPHRRQDNKVQFSQSAKKSSSLEAVRI
ncbi:MAG: hypothetical protein KGY38_02865 [Desulfobacterales bacterium]|nr:hypothetical protein [Desulfobacterales bacterium]